MALWAARGHQEAQAEQGVAGWGGERWTSLDMDERGVVRRAGTRAPTSKRSDRLAQLATNAMEKRNKSSDQVNVMRFRLR